MQKKSEDFSINEAARVAKSPAGAQLLAMLQQADAAKLQQAARQASNGQYQEALSTIETLLSSEEAKKLLKELEG